MLSKQIAEATFTGNDLTLVCTFYTAFLGMKRFAKVVGCVLDRAGKL